VTEVKKTKRAELLKRIEELLDDPDCIVRVQRELSHEVGANMAKGSDFVSGKRVTIIIVGTAK
jgi:hypothetical protein